MVETATVAPHEKDTQPRAPAHARGHDSRPDHRAADRQPSSAQPDLAPTEASSLLERTGGTPHTSRTPARGLLQVEAVKRKKTRGEHVFNAAVYGGIMWGANEVISTIIGRGVIKGEGVLETATRAMTSKPELLKKGFDKITLGRPNILQALKIFVLTIGGNLLVPVTKYVEDRKGIIVRWIDSFLESKDPKHAERLEHAHVEMDNAPKQSWSTLWKGRLTVLAAAIGLDMLIGNEKSPSVALFKNTRFDNWSSMARASTSLTRSVVSFFKPAMRETIANARAISPHAIIESVESALEHDALKNIPRDTLSRAVEGKRMGFAADNGFVLVLSAATAFCFYLTSKIFARKRDENKHLNETASQEPGRHQAHTDQIEQAPDKANPFAEKPATTIARPETTERMATAPSLQVAG